MKKKFRSLVLTIAVIASIIGCTKDKSFTELYHSANETMNSANSAFESAYEALDSASSTFESVKDKYLPQEHQDVLERSKLVIDKKDQEITTDDILSLDFESPTTVNELFNRFPKYAIEIPQEYDFYQVEGQEQLVNSLRLDKPDYIIDPKTNKTLLAASLVTQFSVDSHRGNQQKFNEDPIGWSKNKKVVIPYLNGEAYRGWFFNRSHLVADSLGGPAIAENAVTATRTQNVGGPSNDGGMRLPEEIAYDFVNDTNSTKKEDALLYLAKPMYQQGQIIPCAVIVHFENEKHHINRTFIIFNTANGFILNYRDGSFSKIK